jgi:hypothetical protein
MRACGRALVAAMLVACGGSGETRPAPVTTAIDLTATPAGADDVIVARVDGRPVYGSCVAAQAAGRGVDRATALDDCVSLELLAGAALARGLDRDAELAAARRDAAATRLVDLEFRARYRQWDDLPSDFRAPLLEQNRERMKRPESRKSWYARVKVAPDERGGPRDAAAERAIRQLATNLGGRADLFKADLDRELPRAVAAVDATLPYEVGEGMPTERDFGLQEDFRLALFTVPEPGGISAPVRTPWGWDMVLYADYRRPPQLTEAELGAKLFPAARLAYWERWMMALVKKHQVGAANKDDLATALGERREPTP